MKKLQLNVAELAVDSFTTEWIVTANGTVRGNSVALTFQNCGGTFNPERTCNIYCNEGSVELSCNCDTQDCTGNVHHIYCHDSRHYCEPTVQVTSCEELC